MSGPPRHAVQDDLRRTAVRVAAPGALVAGLVAAGLAMAALPSPTQATSASVQARTVTTPSSSFVTGPSGAEVDALDLGMLKRETRTTRNTGRPALKTQAAPDLHVEGTRFTTVALNVRTEPKNDAKLVTVLKPAATVKITDTTKGQWRLIVRDGKGRWVKKKYLATKKPKLAAAISNAPCTSGSGMESGLTSDAIAVHRALCARYPQVSAFGGVRLGDGGEHGSGRAVDAMISNSTVGWEMAHWLRANAKRLGVSEVIYSQQIWTVQRSGEGWRSMPDRGSATANHYDHVHVTVYGSSAS
ncbi:MAG TPA: SH3 domain-containing protein [Microlunatus sp.]|nr:SH3 domain-containing protein [Microlunatus sp.]